MMSYTVVAKMNGNGIEPIDPPEYCSKPMAGDVVDVDGVCWRVVDNHNSQRFRGWDVTDEYRQAVDPDYWARLQELDDYMATVDHASGRWQ
jgi:hypothetical protein